MELVNLKIDKGIFEKILRDSLSDDTIEILRIEYNCLSEKGLNFLSELYAVSVIYNSKKDAKTERTFDLFIKTEPLDNMSLDYLRERNYFSLELRFALEVLPRITKLIHRQLGPHLFHGTLQPPVLIMENLKTQGYVLKDRQKGVSLEHCRLVVENIAKMHAGSVAILEEDPELIESFKEGGIISRKNMQAPLTLINSSLMRISNQVEQWPDEWSTRVAKKLAKLCPIVEEQLADIYDFDPDDFCVLNHGDCWINNLMFKEDEKGQPVDVLMVDYQMAVYSSAAIDVLHFLCTCPEREVRYNNDDYFIKLYLDTLKETMESIGCKRRPPTMEQLKAAMHKRRLYAVIVGIIFSLRMIADKEDIEEFKDIADVGETRMDVFKNPDAIKMAQKLFPSMDAKGYLD
ncbi:uncharacterized protein LOC143430643 [Xylocopa sonorina]|uniref:uncharacterized protein LOC143430643 n=1 Tax=Xylocopa sonorina TaxID=1818115 RepID=UPI00403AAD57